MILPKLGGAVRGEGQCQEPFPVLPSCFQNARPNLVKGMNWFQNTMTKRFNGRHKLPGHLFAGRYKAVLVEETEYLTTLIHYVHLNPARAKMVSPGYGSG